MKSIEIKTIALIICVMVLSLMTTGCVTNPLAGSTAAYEQKELYRQVPVEVGVIISIKTVKIKAATTNNFVSTGLGAVVGASAFRKNNSYEKAISATVGGIIGSMLGSTMTAQEGDEIVVQMKGSRIVRITQPKGDEPFVKGQLVAVSDGRVTILQ